MQPRKDWTFWDENAERVHRIPRDILEAHGRPIEEVAHDLNKNVDTETVFSDGWEVDSPWLSQLYERARVPCQFHFSALDFILSEEQMEIWHEAKDRVIAEMEIKRHRASLDALVIQETFVRTSL